MHERIAQSNVRRTASALALAAVLLTCAFPAAAADGQEAAKAGLARIFAVRADLRQAFLSDWTAVPSPRTAGMRTLEDWARQYGAKEYPDELAWYGTGAVPAKETS